MLDTLPDIFGIADVVEDKFRLGEDGKHKLIDFLPYVRPERFELSYREGAALVDERKFGAEVRGILRGDFVTQSQLLSYDRKVFELVGMLEFHDRHGKERALGLLRDQYDNRIPVLEPRVLPIQKMDVLPLIREATACLYEAAGGRKASKHDFRRGPGKGSHAAVPGSPADFILTILAALGWKVNVSDIKRGYRNLLDIPWRLSDLA